MDGNGKYVRLLLVGLLAVGLWGSLVSAQEHFNLDAKAILAQQAAIRADAIAGEGRYKDLTQHDRNRLFALQDRVASKLSGQASTTGMSEYNQITVFNALEAISAILNGDEDERMICARKRQVGTNRPETVCRTVAQRRVDHEIGAEFVHRRDQR